MIYVLLVVLGFVAFFIVKAALRANQGMKYLHHCQRTFSELVTQGHSQQEALRAIIQKDPSTTLRVIL